MIIEEPTEEELNVLLSKPVESDNSSPGAEVPLQVVPSTTFNLGVDDHLRLCISLIRIFFFSICRKQLELQRQLGILSKVLIPL